MRKLRGREATGRAHSDFEEAQAHIERTGVGDEPLTQHVETLVDRSAVWAALDEGAAADALPGIRRVLDTSNPARVSLAAIGHGLRAAEPFLGPDELRDLCAARPQSHGVSWTMSG